MSLRFEPRRAQPIKHSIVRQHLTDSRQRVEVVPRHSILCAFNRLNFNADPPVVEAEIADSSRGFGLTEGTDRNAAERQHRHFD